MRKGGGGQGEESASCGPTRRANTPWPGVFADAQRPFGPDMCAKGQNHRACRGGVGSRGAARRRACRLGAVSFGARRASGGLCFEALVLRGLPASALLAMALARYAKRGMRTRRGAGLLAGQLVARTRPGRAYSQTRSGPSGRTCARKVNTTEPSGEASEYGALRGGELAGGAVSFGFARYGTCSLCEKGNADSMGPASWRAGPMPYGPEAGPICGPASPAVRRGRTPERSTPPSRLGRRRTTGAARR